MYVGNQRKVYRGRALVVVKSTDESGEIKLVAQADGLDGAEISIRSYSP
jgi:beta-galactosidase